MRAAVAGLASLGWVLAVSSLWKTAPVGGVEQPDFLNAVATLDTVRGPRPLLDACLSLEHESGRERRQRWGPRTLDLDLLLYGNAEIDAPGMIIPHPRMTARRFVLAPLLEAWPTAVVPGHGPVSELVTAVESQGAEPIEGGEWWR